FNNLGFLASPVGRNDKGNVLANRLLGCVAEHSFGSLVPTSDCPIETLANHCVVREIHDGGQQTVGSLRPLTLADVQHGSEKAKGRPVAGMLHLPTELHPHER